MNMTLKIKKFGNSQGIFIPLKALKSKNKDGEWEADITEEKIVITPPRPTLEEMIASVGEQGFEPEISTGNAVGNEIF